MSDIEKVESARASREARDAVAHARASSTTEAVDAALKKYLAAETYFTGHENDVSREEKPDEDDR